MQEKNNVENQLDTNGYFAHNYSKLYKYNFEELFLITKRQIKINVKFHLSRFPRLNDFNWLRYNFFLVMFI